ncbi:hypothetical protein [Gaoshiqia sp. Z1-71]|uniref:hypothetical protein n=1 Tax=Gaoshiqia hydrogeniformans TaxID=3290090 RepID=UPI003BF88D24
MKSGCIKLEVFVYNDPGGDLYDSYQLPISTLYFLDDEFIEQVPITNNTTGFPPFAYIRDRMFAPLNTLVKKKELLDFYPLSRKNFGAVFVNMPVPNYDIRRELPDTCFNGYNYKRIRVASNEEYSVFYIHQTDTILPFSLGYQVEKDYGGILNRIDTYEIKNDRFISLRMYVSKGIPEMVYSSLKNYAHGSSGK